MFTTEELSASLTTHFQEKPLANQQGQAVADVIQTISNHVAKHYPHSDAGHKSIDHFFSAYGDRTAEVALWVLDKVAPHPHRDKDEKKEYHRRYRREMKRLELAVVLSQPSGGPKMARTITQFAFLLHAADALQSLLATLTYPNGDLD